MLIGLALLAYVGYFLVYTHYAAALFRFPFDYDQGEGFELADTLMLSRGEWPYQDIEAYPFYSSNYPPIFHIAVVPLVWLFGPEYWTGRAVAYAGTLITAALIGLAVKRASGRWWLALLSGLAFLASNYIYHVGPLFRQHLFMLMFETAAVVLAARVIESEEWSARRNNWGWLGVVLLLLAAGYTKQLAYATVAAVFIFLFLRQPKRAVAWAAGFAAAAAGLFFLINWATGGHWLLNTVTANLNPFLPGQSLALYLQWLKLHTVLAVVAAGMAVYQLYFERLSAYAIWFVVAVANAATAGKWGAGESYFATAVAASCLLTGVAFGRLLDWARGRSFRLEAFAAVVVALLFLVQAARFFHMPTHTPWLRAIALSLGKAPESVVRVQTSCSEPWPPVSVAYIDSADVGLLGRPPTPADTAAGVAISQLIAEGDTPAFSEEAGFNLYLGRDVVTNPTQLLNLYQNNQVELGQMLAMLEDQAFDTVVLRAQFYPPPVLEAIGRNYHTSHLVQMNGFVYCVLRPNDPLPAEASSFPG
ncbi:MAG: hypothetical protein ACRDHL_11535 [Candidatus Promineifilaceae bacterium]